MRVVLNVYLLILACVVEMQNEMRPKVRMAKAASVPIRVPGLALAHGVNQASVDAKGFTAQPVFRDEFSQLSRAFKDQLDKIRKGHLWLLGLSSVGVQDGGEVGPDMPDYLK